MKCLYCGSLSIKVTDTVPTNTKVLRRRKCKECGNTFFTEEKGYKISDEKGVDIMQMLNALRVFRAKEARKYGSL